MLELKHITKEYRSKKGGNTLAVNNVSLVFEKTGMTFLLGKSGSGKSTLLNIIGGLDQYDSGEMVILGKSTSEFTREDFDSYRNTYVGFIFQEFHVLEDYTVYENILLALQLQKKEVNPTKIQTLLAQLELTELKDRKINELSGGQKQRVAIARALIKDPKIILADEPTGNLDSKTSRQVLDLLKEISKEKLVIVVSHDEESAKEYADRIIEIRDGSVIHDSKEVKEIPKQSEKFQLIRSKLPTKESFRLGFGTLKHKKIRLCVTVILTACALFFLGLSDTMSAFQMAKAHAKLMSDNKMDWVSLQHMDTSSEIWNRLNLPFEQKDIDAVKGDVSDYVESYQISVDHMPVQYSSLGINLGFDYGSDRNYYSAGTNGSTNLQVVPLKKNQTWVQEEIVGRLPEKDDEIMISNYVADIIQKYGLNLYSEELELPEVYYPKSDQELVNQEVAVDFVGLKTVKIVGVIQYDLSKYDAILETVTNDSVSLYYELQNRIESMYNRIYVSDGFLDGLGIRDQKILSDNYIYAYGSNNENLQYGGYFQSPEGQTGTYFDGSEYHSISQLKENQMVITPDGLSIITGDNYYEKLENYLSKFGQEEQETATNTFFEHFVANHRDVIGQKTNLYVQTYSDQILDEESNVEIVGVIAQEGYCYLSSKMLEKYMVSPIQITELLFRESDRSNLENLFDQYSFGEEYEATTVYSTDLLGINQAFDLFKKVAFYISLVFAAFALILIANFIFSSIAYRKKEIGILRALGARGSDVFKIFMWEGLLLALISGILAVCGTVAVCAFLNPLMTKAIGIGVTPLMFGMRQCILIFVTVFLIDIIASFLPIRKISRMKPIDAILKK